MAKATRPGHECPEAGSLSEIILLYLPAAITTIVTLRAVVHRTRNLGVRPRNNGIRQVNFSYYPLYGFLDNSELVHGINYFTPNKNALPPTFLPFLSLATTTVTVITIVIATVTAIVIAIAIAIAIVIVIVIVIATAIAATIVTAVTAATAAVSLNLQPS